jgi:hypothetical protein
MLNTVLRWIERAMAPTAELIGSMPPSAIRQVLFSI